MRRTSRRRPLLIVVAVGVAAAAAVVAASLVLFRDGGEKQPPAKHAPAAARPGLRAPAEQGGRGPAVFMAPGGSGDCSRNAPCGMLDAALHAARPGAVVEVAAGTYPAQVLTAPAGAATRAGVTVRPAKGAQVRFGQVRCGASSGDVGPGDVELADITIAGIIVNRCDRITLRRVTVRGGVFVEGSTNFSMIGGSVGPGVDYHSDVSVVYNSNPPIVPRNVLFDGVLFHDWVLRTPGTHIECLQVSDVIGLTVRDSRFERCDTFDLHVQGSVAGPVRDVVIDGNHFGPTSDHSGSTPAYYSLSVRSGIGVRITNNVSPQGWAFPAKDAVVSNWRVAGNAAPLQPWQCDDRIAYRTNRWSAAECGPGDRSGALPAQP